MEKGRGSYFQRDWNCCGGNRYNATRINVLRRWGIRGQPWTRRLVRGYYLVELVAHSTNDIKLVVKTLVIWPNNTTSSPPDQSAVEGEVRRRVLEWR